MSDPSAVHSATITSPAGNGARPPAEPGQAIPWAVRGREPPVEPELDDPTLYFNRELSWLDFNWRVVHQAMDERVPLLERVRFLAIAESNLDEFYAKRVGGLRRQCEAGVRQRAPDGRTPEEQLDVVRPAADRMHRTMTRLWEDTLRPRLAADAGLIVHSYDSLSPEQRSDVDAYFRSNIYPILTPLAVDPGHPFPFISTQSLSLAVLLEHPERGTTHFARVKIPTDRQRWLAVGPPRQYLPLEELVQRHVGNLFPGMRILSAHQFRVIRSVDLERDDEEVEDLLQMISEELRARRFAPVVRLEAEAAMPENVQKLLRDELELDPEDIDLVEGLVDLNGLFPLADLPIPELRYSEWEPVTPRRFAEALRADGSAGVFDVIRSGDVLVHLPYESFATTVQAFIEAAAVDPKVLAIKQTLYRTSENSPVVQALARAAEAGKQVAVLVEVTARFDEQKNIDWGQTLERAGAHVTYGVMGLKTHAKVVLVIREEADGIRTYCHIGTGNYHARTARLYTDLGLLTADPTIGQDAISLFHILTGYAIEQQYATLLVAPRDMRRGFVDRIEREIAHACSGTGGRIIAKMNAIDDVPIIRKLYEASRAGVQIDLIVRGHSRLRPGLPGVSENIRVISILGRFLEHDRVFYFQNGGEEEVLICSADWRRRNLEERVEAAVPIADPELRRRLLEDILLRALHDNRSAWDLHPDGSYSLRDGEGAAAEFQRELMEAALERHRPRDDSWRGPALSGVE